MEKLFSTSLNFRLRERIVWRLFVGLDWELEGEGDGEKSQGGTRGRVEMLKRRRRKREEGEGKREFERREDYVS